MSSLNVYSYNFEKIDKNDQNIDILFNLEQTLRSSKKPHAFRN